MQKRKRRLSRLIKKASQSLRPQAQRSPIIFFGDMCGEENTSQAASVEFVRRRRTNYARCRLQPLCQKVLLFDSFLTALRYALLLEKRSLPSAAVRMPQTMTMSAQMIVVGVSTLVSPRNTAVKKIAQAA